MANEGRAHTVSDIDQYVDHGRVLKFMQPFGAYVDYDNLKKHQVELVPQSVKESIMSESVLENRRLQTWDASIEGATNETLFKQYIESLEGWIMDLCFMWLSLYPISDTNFLFDDHLIIAELV